jgi:hypothetical protein
MMTIPEHTHTHTLSLSLSLSLSPSLSLYSLDEILCVKMIHNTVHKPSTATETVTILYTLHALYILHVYD